MQDFESSYLFVIFCTFTKPTFLGEENSGNESWEDYFDGIETHLWTFLPAEAYSRVWFSTKRCDIQKCYWDRHFPPNEVVELSVKDIFPFPDLQQTLDNQCY